MTTEDDDDVLKNFPADDEEDDEDLYPALRKVPIPSLPPKVRRMLLPFNVTEDGSCYGGVGHLRVYTAYPQVTFKPKGLMIWGAPDDADVNQVWIGKDLQVIAAFGPISAKWFSMAQSYEQIEKALKEGIDPPSWPDFDIVQIAMSVKVHIQSQQKLPQTKIVMWGFGVNAFGST